MSSTRLDASPGQPADTRDLLAQAQRALVALAAQPVDARGGDGGERIEVLAALRSRVDALVLEELAVFECRGGHRAAGCKTVGSWARLHLRLTQARASQTVGLARALTGLPQVAAALAEGAIGVEQVEAIVAAARRVGAVELGRHQDTLVQLARQASASEVRAAVAEIVRLAEADPHGDAAARRREADRRAAEAEGSRCFDSRRVGDQLVFSGATDLATGEALVAYVDAHATPAPGPDGARDERTPTQRRADAFTRLVHTAVDAPADAGGMPERVRSAAAVTMTISVETLLGLAGSGPLLERLGRVPSPTARRLLCEGTLTRIILDESGEPIDIHPTGRAHTTAQAKALALHHPTCAFPGCGVPFRGCHIHHIQHWADGGRTETANLVPLCGTHHRWHHEGGYTLTVAPGPGRTFTFHDTLGRTIPDPDNAKTTAFAQLPLDTLQLSDHPWDAARTRPPTITDPFGPHTRAAHRADTEHGKDPPSAA